MAEGNETGSALDEWLQIVGETKLQGKGRENPVYCDYCDCVIRPNEPMTNYAVDRLVLDEGDTGSAPFHLIRAYCNNCDRRRVRFPCKGFFELIIAGRVTPEYSLVDLEVIDYSSADEGYTWDPRKTWNAVFDFPLEMLVNHPTSNDLRFGPEDVVDYMVKQNIDFRDAVDDSGAIDYGIAATLNHDS